MQRSDGRFRLFMLCVEAWLLIPLFAVALRVVPGAVLRHVRQSTPRHGADGRGLAARAAMAVERATRCLPARLTTCLPLACAVHVMLARRGVRSHLRIGVAKESGDALRAHAWVEADGIEIGLDTRRPPFATLPVS